MRFYFLIGVLILIVIHNDLSQAMLTDSDQLIKTMRIIKTSHQNAQDKALSSSLSSSEEDVSIIDGHNISISLEEWEDCPGCLQNLIKTMKSITHIKEIKEENDKLM